MEPLDFEQRIETGVKALSYAIDILRSITTEALPALTINRARELINGMRKPLYILEEIGQDIMNVAILNDLDKAGATAASKDVVTLSYAVDMRPPAKSKYTKQQVVGKKAVGFER